MLPLSCDPCNTEQSMNVSQNYNSSHRLPKRSSRPEACPMTDPFALQRIAMKGFRSHHHPPSLDFFLTQRPKTCTIPEVGSALATPHFDPRDRHFQRWIG
jgi:hypothetical protein